MGKTEKSKNTRLPISSFLILGLLFALIRSFSAFFVAQAEGEIDILFLQAADDGNTYLYGFDLDSANSEARLLLDEPIDAYDAYKHWVVYVGEKPNRSIMRLDVATGEQNLFYQCEPESDCGEVHFGANEDCIVFRQKDVSVPLSEFRSLYQLCLEAEPQTIQGAVDSIEWITETHLLISYNPMGEGTSLNLYDAVTGSLQEIAVDCYFCGGVSRSFTSDARYYLESTDYYLELKNILGETVEMYTLPNNDYGPLYLEDWNPENKAVLYTAYRLDTDSMETGGSHIFLFDATEPSHQALWTGDEFNIYGMKWNPDGTAFSFIATPLNADWSIQEGQIWIYDMASREASPLPASGYAVQWIE